MRGERLKDEIGRFLRKLNGGDDMETIKDLGKGKFGYFIISWFIV